MKKLPVLLLLLSLFAACKKDTKQDTGIIIEPPAPRISSDTLKTGDLWGLAIGTNAADLYAKILSIKAEKKLTNMQIVGNIFTKVDSLQNRLPLYTFVYLDHAVGTAEGIQIYFTDDKVSSIWTNGGTRLFRWPASSELPGIAAGDAISDVYPKLLSISKVSSYVGLFDRISVFNKDLNKAYDPYMALSRQWYFVAPGVDASQYRVIELNLKDGKLFSVTNILYQYN